MDTPIPTAVSDCGPAPCGWSGRTKAVVSLLLLWHVSAIMVGPAAVEPTSGLMSGIFRWYRPYLDTLYLNHGYRFFAPEPGPSHLIRYDLTLADGSRKSGYFPHKRDHQPRLLYHRHFMLSEHLSQFAEPGVPPELLQTFSRSYGEHLLHEHQAQQVKLVLVRHMFPQPQPVLEGMTLTDKSLYFERPLGVFKADGTVAYPDIPQPDGSPGRIEHVAERLPR